MSQIQSSESKWCPFAVTGKDLAKNNFMLAILLAMIIVFSFIPGFLTFHNLVNIMAQGAVLSVVTLGMTIALIAGKFDLSVGSIISLTGVLSIGLQSFMGLPLSLLVTLLVGLAVGAVNGVLIGFLGADALIVTLGMLSVVGAAALLYTNGATLSGNSHAFTSLTQSSWAHIPTLVIYPIILTILAHLVLRHTVFGRKIYFVGDNAKASILVGIKPRRVIFTVFLISALLASIGGILLSSWVNSASPVAGVGWELNALAAAVLGGTSMFGAEGRMSNALVGALIFSVISNVIVLLKLPVVYQEIVEGIIIVVAVAIRRGRVN
ncbi:ABC transporter permease [Alicyclobacillus kakegawensis]|uniref:ABC transporter permease n=1 Tax=Alicyclobacillus kakegawensis TaxID=392012 RepID=UPI0008320472|nr:ABC transporter permease [Alicyclobacillus kakegawensis]